MTQKKKKGFIRSKIGGLLGYAKEHPCPASMIMFVTGIIFWGGFNMAMEMTNTESFCISCHEMRDNVYQEYKKTIHYSNSTGVKATCPDCHVPREWVHKVARKIGATNELYHKIMGTISTREKFLQRRLHLSKRVWKMMKDTDSRECRNCHSFRAMALNKQSRLASRKHAASGKQGKTCIDCHMGIAHRISKDFDSDGKLHARFKKEKRDCSDCHKGMAVAPD